MSRDDVLAQLQDILHRDFRIARERITPQATFRGTLGMDSLDTVDLVFLVCKHFGLKPDLHPFRDLHSVEKVVDYLVKAVPPPAASNP